MAVFFLVLAAACSKSAPENPFNYPFIKQLHLKRQAGKPYFDYKAFYILTEDFEPLVEQYFKTVGELTEAKVLYPITLRDLLAIISEQQ